MFWLTVLIMVIVVPCRYMALICTRHPANTLSAKSPVDENFAISISGNPDTYILGQSYNISLNAFNGHRFISFKLALENDDGFASYDWDLGRFELSDTVETRFSPKCVNIVENTNNNPKTRVDVMWVAPEQPGSGCILIRATVLQHRDVWYMDDGGLTKRICEESSDDVESSAIASAGQECCACDEARYELVFEGTWSRNHHPKDFPAKGWIARFSDIVGAAHSPDYRFWEYGALAEEGIKELAEHGSTRTLEREFNYNFKNGKIRTIIKTRGPAFPNLNGQSVSSVRVDPQHHLLSLASKIEPSPDWIVGVSGMELCMKNCTWLKEKTVTLYPWDVGTDAGATYTSPDQPQVPPDVIRRMRSDFPNDPRSPFYDETGAPIKPLAILIIRRQRLYERLCQDEESNNIDVARECFTHPWSAWSPCSSKCGEGRQYRTRVYKQPEVARIFNCDEFVVNRQDRTCMGDQCTEPLSGSFRSNRFEEENAELPEGMIEPIEPTLSRTECQLMPWGPWSDCSRTCGEGKRTRRRQYVRSESEEKCQRIRFMQLLEHSKCIGHNCLAEMSHRDRNLELYESQPGKESEYKNFQSPEIGEDESGNGAEEKPENTFSQPRIPGSRKHHFNEFKSPAINEQGNYIVDMGVNEKDTNVYSGNVGQRPHDNREDVNLKQNFETMQNENDFGYGPNIDNSMDDVEDPASKANFNFPYERNRQTQTVTQPVAHCYEPLRVFTCLDTTVVGNFWFYNYCADECMLYAADTCDQNENRFNSLEKCEEECRQPEHANFLRRKQEQDCFEPQRRKSSRQYHQRYNKMTRTRG